MKIILKMGDKMGRFNFRNNLELMLKDEIYKDITFDDFVAAINANLDHDFEDLRGFREAVLLSTADIIQSKTDLSDDEVKERLTVVLVRVATMTDEDFEKFIIKAENQSSNS